MDKKFKLRESGFALVEIMVAAGMLGLLSLGVSSLMSNMSKSGRQIEAKIDFSQAALRIAGMLSAPGTCLNTFGPVVNSAAAVTAAESAAGLDFTEVLDSKGDVFLDTADSNNNTEGRITFVQFNIRNLDTSSGTAELYVRGTYKTSKSITMEKVEIVPMVFTIASDAVDQCATSGSGDIGPWARLVAPDLGIFYNSGSVLIGTGTASNGDAANPNLVSGNANNVDSNTDNCFVSGSENNADTAAVDCTILGNDNTVQSAMGFANGFSNTVSADGGFASGYSNTISGAYSQAMGLSNTVSDIQNITLGALNNSAGIYNYTLGLGNHLTGTNNIIMGHNNGNTDFNTTVTDPISSNYNYILGSLNKSNTTFALVLGTENDIQATGSVAVGNLNTNYGIYSTTIGYDNEAGDSGNIADVSASEIGGYAIAMGKESKANSRYSFAAGYNAQSLAENAVALGYGSNSSGISSVAIGQDNTASGASATAFGISSQATGDYSFATGYASEVSGEHSYALGFQNEVDADYSYALGYENIITNTEANSHSYSIGYINENYGSNSTVIGSNSIAYGKYNIALGNGTIAGVSTSKNANLDSSFDPLCDTQDSGIPESQPGAVYPAARCFDVTGYNAIALGSHAQARGQNSVAISTGDTYSHGAISEGNGAVAIGRSSYARGNGSVSLGGSNVGLGSTSTTSPPAANSGTKAVGRFSFAWGHNAQTFGNYSGVFGKGLQSKGMHTYIFGANPYGNYYVEGDRETHVVNWDNVVINSLGQSTIISGQSKSATEAVDLIIGNHNTTAGDYIMQVDLNIDNGGDWVAAMDPTGTWAYNSDRNKKTNFKEVDEDFILDQFAKMEIETWNYIFSKDKSKQNIGPMAQDFYALFAKPLNLGSTDKTIRNTDVDGVTMSAVVALSRKAQRLESENNDLKDRVNNLEKEIQLIKEMLNQ